MQCYLQCEDAVGGGRRWFDGEILGHFWGWCFLGAVGNNDDFIAFQERSRRLKLIKVILLGTETVHECRNMG